MYPNLYYVFQDLFGINLNGLKLINTFGFFVAIAFIGAAYTLTKELKRKEGQGLLNYTEEEITIGKPASAGELLLNFLLGFLMGYKIIGAFTIPNALNDPQNFIFSSQGNWLTGILIGSFFTWLKWREKNVQKKEKPEHKIAKIQPHERVGDLVIYAAIFGFLGAKIFHNLENWNDFIKDPIDALLSFSGLTFYGGLICAALAIYFYAKKNKIAFIHLCDAAAPGLILAYAIGRIGCQVAGDGDWGILNSAFISNSDGTLAAVKTAQFQAVLNTNANFYINQFGSLQNVQHLNIQPFWGLPNWLFAYNYPHNVINEGTAIVYCMGNYCHQLPIAVFPTPFYETLMSALLFFLLWFLRKKIKIAGRLFAVYLIVNGLERFLIEKIRVNTKYNFGSFHPTQAEIISTLLVIAGIILYFQAAKIDKAKG